MIQLKVKYIGIDQTTGHPLVLLADPEEQELLPIMIGPYEAGAILAGVEGRQFERPMTHDLLADTIRVLKGNLTKVTISEVVDGTFYADLHIETPSGEVIVDSRPSDGIALALRFDADIFVTPEVAEDSLVPAERFEGIDDDDPEKEEFLSFLKDITPEDFRKNLE